MFLTACKSLISLAAQWLRHCMAWRLDMDYLHKWGVELKVADLLQRALKESE
jgi:hypothetical protein